MADRHNMLRFMADHLARRRPARIKPARFPWIGVGVAAICAGWLVACAPVQSGGRVEATNRPSTSGAQSGGVITPWGGSSASSGGGSAADMRMQNADAGLGSGSGSDADPGKTPTPMANTRTAPQSMPMQSAPAGARPMTGSGAIVPNTAQQRQIDQARIALDILDRMAKRCVEQNDAAACNTLQVNWSTLSAEIRHTLGALSGEDMVDSPVVTPQEDANPISSDLTPAPVKNTGPMPSSTPDMAPASGADDTTKPMMEKEIPLIPAGN